MTQAEEFVNKARKRERERVCSYISVGPDQRRSVGRMLEGFQC